MEYLLIGCFFLLLSTIEVIKYNKFYSYLMLILCSIIMILFAGLRDGTIVGTDSPAYFYNYQYPLDYEAEYGYKYLAAFFSKTLDANYNLFLLVINTLSIGLIATSLKKNSYFLISESLKAALENHHAPRHKLRHLAVKKKKKNQTMLN